MVMPNNNSASPTRMFPTRNPIAPEAREKLAAELNNHLATSIALYTHIKHAHWNVQGEGFVPIHELLDKIGEDAQEWADLIAERVRQLGGLARGTIQQAAERSALPAYPDGLLALEQHVAAVADRLSIFSGAMESVVETASDHNDAVTADICTEIARAADKHLWFLESSLPPGLAATGNTKSGAPGRGAGKDSKGHDEVDESSMESFPASDAPAVGGHKAPKDQPSRSTAGAPSRLGNSQGRQRR